MTIFPNLFGSKSIYVGTLAEGAKLQTWKLQTLYPCFTFLILTITFTVLLIWQLAASITSMNPHAKGPQRNFSKVKKRHPTCKRLELATHGNLTFRAQGFTGNLTILRAQQGSQLSWTAQTFEILSLISADPNHVSKQQNLSTVQSWLQLRFCLLELLQLRESKFLYLDNFICPSWRST